MLQALLHGQQFLDNLPQLVDLALQRLSRRGLLVTAHGHHRHHPPQPRPRQNWQKHSASASLVLILPSSVIAVSLARL